MELITCSSRYSETFFLLSFSQLSFSPGRSLWRLVVDRQSVKDDHYYWMDDPDDIDHHFVMNDADDAMGTV